MARKGLRTRIADGSVLVVREETGSVLVAHTITNPLREFKRLFDSLALFYVDLYLQ